MARQSDRKEVKARVACQVPYDYVVPTSRRKPSPSRKPMLQSVK